MQSCSLKIELSYLPPSTELVAERQRNVIPALPFCHATLTAPKPKPTAYPKMLKMLGDHLRKRRMDLGWLQKQVAQEIGVSEATIYNWENNRTYPAQCFNDLVIQFIGYNPLL